MDDHCPVCGSGGASVQARRDKKRLVDCHRCGQFVITKDAREFAQSQLAGKKKAEFSARASHGIALMTSTPYAAPVLVERDQLARMSSEPLPDKNQQIVTLLRWLDRQERAERERHPPFARISAIMGADSTDSAHETISEAEKLGYLDF